ncbi:MAG: hypothetical protein EA352_07825 [Gemmatimonadales bacterium]|nr:MAG: hypothetical protein EA352_07825 [Gemmatimonadales bacterium]
MAGPPDSRPAEAASRELSRGTPRGGAPVPDTLRALYRRYCQVEARELLNVIPRAGVRSLWAQARTSSDAVPGTEDALDRLVGEAMGILPLPPYDVWVRAWMADRQPFLERMGVPATPAGPEPVTVATREVDQRWWAHLNLFRTGDGRWRGFLSFHAQGEPRTLRTAEIFRGDDPAELRRRFREFTPLSLQAFLRSVLP